MTNSFEVNIFSTKNVVVSGTNSNPKAIDLKNMVGGKVYLIQGVKAFGE